MFGHQMSVVFSHLATLGTQWIFNWLLTLTEYGSQLWNWRSFTSREWSANMYSIHRNSVVNRSLSQLKAAGQDLGWHQRRSGPYFGSLSHWTAILNSTRAVKSKRANASGQKMALYQADVSNFLVQMVHVQSENSLGAVKMKQATGNLLVNDLVLINDDTQLNGHLVRSSRFIMVQKARS